LDTLHQMKAVEVVEDTMLDMVDFHILQWYMNDRLKFYLVLPPNCCGGGAICPPDGGG
jgi:hypothetical protein